MFDANSFGWFAAINTPLLQMSNFWDMK